MFRDVFLCRLIVIVQRSHPRACTFNNGPALGDPNCGQSADDHAMMPESIRWFLGCTRSARMKGVVLHVIHPRNVSWRDVRPVSSDAYDPEPSLLEGRYVSLSSTFPASVPCLLPTNYLQVGATAFPNGLFHLWGGFLLEARWWALCPLSVILDAMPWFTAYPDPLVSSCNIILSHFCEHALSYHVSTAPSKVLFPAVFRRFQFSLHKSQHIYCTADQQKKMRGLP